MNMSVRDPLKIRKAVLAGAVALTLTGAGVAIAWAADSPPPSPSPSQSAQGQENRPDKPEKSQRPQHLHSEGVVKKADGTFQTVLEQRGTVEAVSDTSITVKSEDGYSQTYAVNAETKIKQVPAPAADGSSATPDGGKRLKPADGTVADIATGDAVRISGVKNGDQATAERIVEGAGDRPGLGLGLGRGHEKGHDKGHGRGRAK
jgi:Domain of unknown function (DUF5666)